MRQLFTAFYTYNSYMRTYRGCCPQKVDLFILLRAAIRVKPVIHQYRI